MAEAVATREGQSAESGEAGSNAVEKGEGKENTGEKTTSENPANPVLVESTESSPLNTTADAENSPVSFHCQFPPTLRVHRGPNERTGRPHNDAEYGHQQGEVNFWMPLTDYATTKTALWVETAPGAGDYHPLDIPRGAISAFHGTLCRHYAGGNPTGATRVSLDFRIGVGPYFDHMPRGTKSEHPRLVIKA